MGKRFTPTGIADTRAIALHYQIKRVEELPGITLDIPENGKTIFVIDKNNRMRFREWSVDAFLSFDVRQAKERGGTWEALMTSRKPAPRPRVAQAEVDQGVSELLGAPDGLT